MKIVWDQLITNAIAVGLIVLVIALAKRSPGLGALIISLPITTIVAMCFIHAGSREQEGHLERLGSFSTATFWYVLPSLPMFLLMPWLYRRGIGFYPALAIGCLITALLYYLTVFLLRRFAGMEL